ncbi:VOC family protein [Oceanicoccus sp. KOV_DT_Chl]|uniref:VOC family protein n=1 Tax=Oceanicoccus sp. KOV_DT_Chl TaxID=1904639 RepID=UPI000C7AEBC8|nr:VOC family protein [Oceanicoccus sp. KOV_DT_Chl]
MIGYVTIGVSDMEKAKAFYIELLSDIGAKLTMDMGRIAFIGAEDGGTMLSLCVPYNEQAAEPGNGNMIAITPGSKEAVDTLYKKAIAIGASCEGEPGQRIPDMFYGAYFRDPDGNKICFAHFG